jgi:carboxypeptidase C (cathepsin A)
MLVSILPQNSPPIASLADKRYTDWICNWMGNFAVVNNINWTSKSSFAAKAVAPYAVNGTSYGEFKTLGNLSWLRVYAAGHEV